VTRAFQYALGVVILVALPAFATVDDEWSGMYGQAQKAAALKDYSTAETTYNKALHLAELFGKDDVRVASTSQALGNTLRAQKKFSQAEDAIRRAVTIYAVKPGDNSIEFGQAQFDLAAVLIDEGKFEPALQSTKLLLPIFDRNLGPDDNKTAAALCMQGDTYRMLKLYGSAEGPLKRCSEIQAEDGDVGTPAFGETANSLAVVYQHLGKLQEADRYFNYAEKIREISVGIMSAELADTLEAHAALLHQLGRDIEAKPKASLAAAIRAHLARK
jgi:tetratricopeptide (TPR) repeat protein